MFQPRTLHCRFQEKNLFLGERVRLFVDSPYNKDIIGGPLGTAELDAAMGRVPNQGQRSEEYKSELLKEMQEMVPEQELYQPDWSPEAYGEHLKRIEEWQSSFGPYEEIQANLGRIVQWEKELLDPKKLTKATQARFKERYGKIYSDLVAIKGLEASFKGTNVNWQDLEAKARGEIEPTTRGILEDLDRMKRALVIKRKVALEVVSDRAKRDFERRLKYLRNEWKNNPPKGYEKGKDSWIKACDAILEKIKGLPNLDSDDPVFPQNSKVFEELKSLWSGVTDMEHTLKIYREGQEKGGSLSKPLLQKKLDDLLKIKKSKINQHLDEKREKELGATLDLLKNTMPKFKAHMQAAVAPQKISAYLHLDEERRHLLKQLDANPEDATSKNELAKVEKGIEAFQGKEHLDQNQINLMKQYVEMQKLQRQLEDALKPENRLTAIFDKAFNSTETEREGDMECPKGLQAQLDWMTNAPVSPEERNHMFFKFQGVLEKVEKDMQEAENNGTSLAGDLMTRLNVLNIELARGDQAAGWKVRTMSAWSTYEILAHAIPGLFTRSWERDRKRVAGIWGKKGFEFLKELNVPLPDSLKPIREISGELDIEREHAETEDYQHWKKVHEHATVSHWTHLMHDTKNKFEFRAVMELLAEKGRLRLSDDEAFFKQLNRLQHDVDVPVSRYWHAEHRFASEEVLKAAVYALYGDIDMFESWHSKNSSAIKSEGGKYNEKFSELATMKGGLTNYAEDLLKKYKKEIGEHDRHGMSDVDPCEFEAALHYAVDNGKMDAEDVLRLLIQAIACGLLGLDRAAVFTGKNNNYPPIEIFDDASITGKGVKPTLQDVQEWAKIGEEDPREYMDWFHGWVMQQDKVRQRVNKAQGQGMRFDHDYFTAMAPYLSAATLESMLQRRGDGGFGLQPTAAQNGTVGMLFALDTLAESYDEMGGKGRSVLSGMVDGIMRFDAIVSGRMHGKNESYYKMDNETLKANPRYAGNYKLYGRGEMSTEAHLEKMRAYFKLLDIGPKPGLFEKLLTNRLQDADVASHVAALQAINPNIFGKGNTPQNVNDLYKSIGSYVDYLAENRPDIIENFIKTIKTDHGEASKKVHHMRHEVAHRRLHFKEHFLKEMKEGKMVQDPHHHEHHEEEEGHGAKKPGGHHFILPTGTQIRRSTFWDSGANDYMADSAGAPIFPITSQARTRPEDNN